MKSENFIKSKTFFFFFPFISFGCFGAKFEMAIVRCLTCFIYDK